MGFFDRFLRGLTPPPPREARAAERRRSPRAREAAGLKALIVDDSKTVVAYLGRMLQQNRFQILEAFDGESALTILATSDVDIVFLDIVLPGINGFDVLRKIRRHSVLGQRTRVIIMSGNEAATEEYYAKRIGADEFLRKPCTREMVFASVERVMNLPPFAMQAKDPNAVSPLVQDTQIAAVDK
jgi:PleD family two-component response regulator